MGKRKRRVRQAWKKAKAAGWKHSMKQWARRHYCDDNDILDWHEAKYGWIPF